MKKPREIASNVLLERLKGEDYTENLLESALAGTRLSAPDRALCQELVYGVVRQQAALDWLIVRKTAGRPQKTALQILLQLGLYQIFFLDRIPGHAAVNETVELAKRHGFNTQAGFVNAVLRGYLREQEATRALLVDLKSTRPALGWSQPEWLVEKWFRQFGADPARLLLEWNNQPPKTYARVNLLKFHQAGPEGEGVAATTADAAAAALLERWRAEGVGYDFFTRDWTGENLVFELKSHPPLPQLGSFLDGWFYLQDPSTLLAVRELNPQPGETVLDLCAAPGGKTTFIAQLLQNRGNIEARDVSAARLELVRENCTRLGVTCVELNMNEGEIKLFDRVLVDAPCSNTGVMRRRVDLRWRIQPGEITRLRTTQLGLLQTAAVAVKLGGCLVYSTCSLEPEENFEVVREFLAAHPGYKLEAERQLTPFADGVDGAYVARFTRIAG